MDFTLDASAYVAYLKKAAGKIEENGAYISALDAATGDGDHWANINMGFQRLVENSETLAALPIAACFKQIGMLMMSAIGGSSGVLYGGAYIAAAKRITTPALNAAGLCDALQDMADDMMQRGKSKPGYKTMIDAIYPAAQAFRSALTQGKDARESLLAMRQAALEGAASTADMPAIRGRASYQADKGLGHLDPGAVTMSYQLDCLATHIIDTLL